MGSNLVVFEKSGPGGGAIAVRSQAVLDVEPVTETAASYPYCKVRLADGGMVFTHTVEGTLDEVLAALAGGALGSDANADDAGPSERLVENMRAVAREELRAAAVERAKRFADRMKDAIRETSAKPEDGWCGADGHIAHFFTDGIAACLPEQPITNTWRNLKWSQIDGVPDEADRCSKCYNSLVPPSRREKPVTSTRSIGGWWRAGDRSQAHFFKSGHTACKPELDVSDSEGWLPVSSVGAKKVDFCEQCFELTRKEREADYQPVPDWFQEKFFGQPAQGIQTLYNMMQDVALDEIKRVVRATITKLTDKNLISARIGEPALKIIGDGGA